MQQPKAWPDNEPTHQLATQAPPERRAPESPNGLDTVPVGDGGAWPATHRQ